MENVENSAFDMSIVKAYLDNIFSPLATNPQHSVDWQHICNLFKQVVPLLDENAIDEIIGATALHPVPEVRKRMIEVFTPQIDQFPSVQQLLIWCMRDTDEQVALHAIRACASSNSSVFWPELYALLGRDASRVQANQELATMGLREAAARQVLRDVYERGLLSDFEELDPYLAKGTGDNILILKHEVDATDMVYIEAGPFISGLPILYKGVSWFAVDDLFPESTIDLKAFYIDKDPVTNEDYDLFCDQIEENGHLWCHPDETPGKDHRRSTLGDVRVEKNHPVCGVDWYDAFAYASWQGKSLPTALQWEKAARGSNGYLYPWGNNYDSVHVNDADRVYNCEFKSLEALLEAQSSFSSEEPQHFTLSIDELSGNTSPYGVHGMIGNVWEWTRSNYLNNTDIIPHFRALEPAIAMEDWSSWVVVKGGAWSSKAELLLPAYRGRRHLLFRSPDVGFRCVYEA
ncbi:formylglycine-generating enzyme family protein [Tengunoibacter tsumagoiensis]|uniref:Sulfatase-modifying factor enzyme-like domain-containing protein n=1 Tax=Tengunoibacter tsumagoiensis TaxID=2014871 RepID=A0A401ZV10_9CHLR|nr:SUMF1/EgtB/PvdO family nonheme iron enzyme [Tengunoibacter tsumagoiensis]GCE10570.1 hypothetical protein KTT_04290 [Tengunoibacter tsumagoiensis]